MRKAKIVCATGPASQNRKTVSELIRPGMDVARLNFSHGDHAAKQEALSLTRSESEKQKQPVSVLQHFRPTRTVATAAVMLSVGKFCRRLLLASSGGVDRRCINEYR